MISGALTETQHTDVRMNVCPCTSVCVFVGHLLIPSSMPAIPLLGPDGVSGNVNTI